MLEQMLEPLRTGWKIWKRIGRFMGDVVGRAFLTLFYFSLFVPFALGVRIWGDPLTMRPRGRPKWLDRRTEDLTLKDSRRLY
jgi:hypothetical protein